MKMLEPLTVYINYKKISDKISDPSDKVQNLILNYQGTSE